MKKITLLLLLMISFTGYSQTAVLPAGSGTSSDPYLISSLGHLYWISYKNSNTEYFSHGKYFLQVNDIDASDTSDPNIYPNTWIPIGARSYNISTSTESWSFLGVYNGNGFSISNLYLVNTDILTQFHGFFGRTGTQTINSLVSNGVILNLRLTNLYISVAGATTGGIVGHTRNLNNIVYNCSTSGTIISTKTTVGGIAGQNQGNIFNCYSTCDVTSPGITGGLIGLNQRGIFDCYSNGTATNTGTYTQAIGGLIGGSSINSIYRSYANSNVISQQEPTTQRGGFSGQATTGILAHNYWNIDKFSLGVGSLGGTAVNSGTGYNSETLKLLNSYHSSWNFVNTWGFGSDGYPTLVNRPNTWLGVNTNWSNTANWSLGVVPSSNSLSLPTSTTAFSAKDLVRIPADLANYPVLTANITTYSITLEDGATIDLNGFSITKSFFFEQTGSTTSTWTGAINTLWNEPTNWNPQLTPPSTNDIVIPNTFNKPTVSNSIETGNLSIQTGASLTLQPNSILKVNGNIINNGQMIFKSDITGSGMFDQFTGTITGNGTVQIERYIPVKRAYRFLCPALSTTTSINANWQEGATSSTHNPNQGFGTHITGIGGATNGFDVTASNNASMYTFNNSSGEWEPVTNTNTNVFTAGTPYRIMVRGDRTTDLTTNTPALTPTTLRAKGTLITGDHSPTLNPASNGYSFIGNPYNAPIDIKTVLDDATTTNMDVSKVYYWDPTLNARGGYVTRDLTLNTNDVSSSFNQYLQTGQAVFLKKDNTTNVPTLTIKESHKSIGNAAAGVFKSTTSNPFGMLRVNLKATVNNQWKTIEGSLALFNDAYSWGGSTEDANKFSNLDEEVSFVQDNTSLAIAMQSNPTITDELPLKLKNTRYTNYQWQFEVTDYDGLTPYLFDTHNTTYTQIDNNTIIPFTVNGQEQTRFKIVFQNTTLNTPEFNTQIVVYPNPGKENTGFYVQGITEAKITVYNIMAQNIPIQTTNNGTTIEVKPCVSLSKGIYFVNIISEEKTKQVKWIVE